MADASIRKLAAKYHSTFPALREWTKEDLVQEIYLKALISIEKFSARSSLKTWTLSVARNHLVSLSRGAKRLRSRIHLTDEPDALYQRGSSTPSNEEDRSAQLRTRTSELLAWLRENPEHVRNGWDVLNLLLWSHGDDSYVALAMTLHTGKPWTVDRVWRTIRKIKDTPKGRVLCDSLGITAG